MDHTRVTPREFGELDGLEDWRFVLGAIRAEFDAGSLAAAGTFAASVAAAGQGGDCRPAISIHHPGRVSVVLGRSTGAVTIEDVTLARTITSLAREIGATARGHSPQALEIAIDTMNAELIRPFWKAVLGYEQTAGGTLVDPTGSGPPVWFQQMDEPHRTRNRIHIDVSVPHDEAEARLAAALSAGGTLVTDEHARSWWVLADADGNEACVSTWQDRE